MTDKELGTLVRRLAEHLRRDELDAFEARLSSDPSPELLSRLRTQKILTRGSAATRSAAAGMVSAALDGPLSQKDVEEYRNYLALSLEICRLREELMAEFERGRRRLPRISLRQLVAVAGRTFSRELERAAERRAPPPRDGTVAENERAIHEASGSANDVIFAVLRALNDCSRGVGDRNLRRRDAIERSIGPFRTLTGLASRLNGLENVLDSASYGDFTVDRHDTAERTFILGFADVRRTLIRQLAIRRRLMHIGVGHRHPRFVRDRLKEIQGAFIADAVDEYAERAGWPPSVRTDLGPLERHGDVLLRCIDAEDDLILLSGRGGRRIPMLYHMSMALRWTSMAGGFVADALPGRTRREFDDRIRLENIVDALPIEEDRHAASLAWKDLTVELPARSHFDILRRPFVRTASGQALPIRAADSGIWATVVRETVNTGGEVGRLYGSVWEEFSATSFVDSGWEVVGRNVPISDGGVQLTEVDLLLCRGDLLLVVELKALTGSGLTPFDHWKSRMTIEKGCRQALLAADSLRDRPLLLPSIVGRQTARRIGVIQPLVLTSEIMFDGWSHFGVPVAGETIRKAITVGTRVDFYDGETLEVIGTEHHLRREELDTGTILRALRDPVELAIAPERGAVEHVAVEVGGTIFAIPNLATGPYRT